MTKSITFALLFCLTLAAQAQVTITVNDMPNLNDTIRLSQAPNTVQVNVSQTGPNQTWSFLNLTANTQKVTKYVSTISTPYAFYFFANSSYGSKVADSIGVAAFKFKNIYNFYKRSSGKFTTEGLGLSYNNIPLAADYSDPDEQYFFPLTYGRRDSSTFAVSLNIPTLGTYKSKGYRITTVDGWGSITTPYGTFSCIRVKSQVFANDSLNIQQPVQFSFGFPNNREEYRWLAPGMKEPLLEVLGTSNNGIFAANSIAYRDSARLWPIATQEIGTLDMQCFPNPGNQILNVQIPNAQNQAAVIEIWDIQGRKMLSENTASDLTKLDVRTLPAGTYLIQVKSAGQIAWQKWVKTQATE